MIGSIVVLTGLVGIGMKMAYDTIDNKMSNIKGDNRDIKTVLKYYDRLIKRKNPRIYIWFNTLNRTGCIWCHEDITTENKELIRECLITEDWIKLFNTGNVKACPSCGGMKNGDYSKGGYSYNFHGKTYNRGVSPSLNIDLVNRCLK
jgi:hypothetical protein